MNLVQCGVGVQAGVGAGGVGPAVAGPGDERGRGVVGPAVGAAGVVRSVGLSTAQRVVGGMAHVYVVVDPWAYGGTVARVSGGGGGSEPSPVVVVPWRTVDGLVAARDAVAEAVCLALGSLPAGKAGVDFVGAVVAALRGVWASVPRAPALYKQRVACCVREQR